MGAPLYSLAGTSWTLGGAMGVTSRQNGYALGPSLFTNASCKQSTMRIYGRFNCWEGETAASKKGPHNFSTVYLFQLRRVLLHRQKGNRWVEMWSKVKCKQHVHCKIHKEGLRQGKLRRAILLHNFFLLSRLEFCFAWENNTEALKERTKLSLKLRNF